MSFAGSRMLAANICIGTALDLSHLHGMPKTQRRCRHSKCKMEDKSRNHPYSNCPRKDSNSEHHRVDKSSEVTARIARLYESQELCDVCLVVNGDEYPCHRIILSSASDVFKAMLGSDTWSESRVWRVPLIEEDMCVPFFDEVLSYFYTGIITINIDNALPVLMLADKYMVSELVKECFSFMTAHMGEAAQTGLLMTWLRRSACASANESFRSFISLNPSLVMSGIDSMDVQQLLQFVLQETDLVIHNEYSLFKYATKWLELHLPTTEVDKREVLMKEVLSHIRFPMMTPRELASLSLCSIANECTDFIMSRMKLGMAYHAWNNAELAEVLQDPANSVLFVPRIYTEEKRATLISVDSYNTLPCYYKHELVFHSPLNRADGKPELTCEWSVSLRPKGVWIPKCYLIQYQQKATIDEFVKKTVRLSIKCNTPMSRLKYNRKELTSLSVKISVLVYGMQGDVECVMGVKQVQHTFSDDDSLYHMDDLVPFDELNPPMKTDIDVDADRHDNPYLTGPGRNNFKLCIVIEWNRRLQHLMSQ